MDTKKTITIEVMEHRGNRYFFLHFNPSNEEIFKAVKSLPDRKYSGSKRRWYVPYTQRALAHLKALPFLIQMPEPATDQGKSNVTDTAGRIGPKGDKIGISSDREEQAADSVSEPSPTADIPKKQTPYSASKGEIHIAMNAVWTTVKMPYSKTKVDQIRTLEKAWWNAQHGVWMVKTSPRNVEALREILPIFSEEEYEQFMEFSRKLAHPILIELYQTPEHPGKIAVKMKGYGLNQEVIKSIPERFYEKEMRRWIIPNAHENVERILRFFSAKEDVTIVNRVSSDTPTPVKRPDLGQQQSYLLSKFSVRHRETLSKMTDAMIRMRYSWNTVRLYTNAFAKYLDYLGEIPATEATASNANGYLSSLSKGKVSESLVHRAVNAIKFYYEKVIFAPHFELDRIKRPKKSHRLPVILEIGEVDRMLRTCKNLKHLAILYTLYSSGLRLGEMLSLRISDLYWDREQIIVRGGKGKKDRSVMLSQTLKAVLRLYFDQYQPKEWLFNGQDGESQYSPKSVQNVVREAARKAQIRRKVTPHVLRHCFATHLLDQGTDVRYIQELLGHKDIKTTLIYTHVTTRSIENIKSPLDSLFSNDKNANV